MAKIFDQQATKGVIIQGSSALAIPSNTRISVRITGAPETNIRLLASVFIYENQTASEVADFLSYQLGLVRQPRSIFYTPRIAPANSILRIIPLYDFTRLEAWITP